MAMFHYGIALFLPGSTIIRKAILEGLLTLNFQTKLNMYISLTVMILSSLKYLRIIFIQMSTTTSELTTHLISITEVYCIKVNLQEGKFYNFYQL